MLFQKFVIVVSYMCWTYLELLLTKVFAKAGLDNLTSAVRKHQQRWFSLGIFPLKLLFGLTGNHPQSAPCSFLR